MPENLKVRIALVGGGTIAPLHAEYLISSPTCELVAIVDPYTPGCALASALSLPHFGSVTALLASLQEPPEAYVMCPFKSPCFRSNRRDPSSTAQSFTHRKALLDRFAIWSRVTCAGEKQGLQNSRRTPPQIQSPAINYAVRDQRWKSWGDYSHLRIVDCEEG